jgi:hypothetical protein
MTKDINYYHTNASFGVKEIGYTKDVVGGGDPVEPKGKYKSSGYGDMPKTVKEGLNEAKKRPGVAAEIKEIEKSNEALALEAKIAKIKEAIAKRESKLQLAETEELAEMIDEKMVKTLQKEIKELEKYKAKAEGLYEKLTKTKSKEVIKDEEITENENPYYDSDPTDGDRDFNMKQSVLADELYEKGRQAYSEGDLLKAEKLYNDALKAGSWLGWTEFDLPPYETLNK